MADLRHVKGIDALNARLKATPAELARKGLRRGVAAGARIVKLTAIAIAPVGTSRKGHVSGTLKRAAIVKFVREESNDKQVTYIVTFRQGKSQQKRHRDAYYARFVEFGHKIVPRSKKATTLSGVLKNRRTIRSRRAAATRRVPPHRFLGPAFERSKQAALTAMIKGIEAGVKQVDHK